jgi:anti-sigma factor RsiW
MNCSRDWIEAYLDDELDAAQHAAIEQHLATCPNCSETCARVREQKARIKAAAPYYAPPLDVQQSVRDALQRAGTEKAKPTWEAPWKWLTVAASLLLMVSVFWNLALLRTRSSEADVAENVLNDHIRSLIGAHLVDVPSSDQHTVKPWFAGKLDFSPAVKDLEAQGFPLVGGRVEYLAGRRVAALVYHRRQHVVTLFIWPDASSSGDARISRNGYDLLHWTTGPMTYWAVSDVSNPDLEKFRTLYRQAER